LSGEVEVFLTRQIATDLWEALVRPSKVAGRRASRFFGKGRTPKPKFVTRRAWSAYRAILSRDTEAAQRHIERFGHVPLPPIEREDDSGDRERYQLYTREVAPAQSLHPPLDYISRKKLWRGFTRTESKRAN
jgi:S-adenosylmethionine:tRNA-ribosyltransferase-isomerase (queuine synthetase)